MSNSPKVDFTFENNNILESAPATGVSFVYAATSKGPVNDPSEIITSVSQFRRIFGEELIKNQPISVIEKALLGGSKLRICRVIGTGSTKGSCTAKVTFTGIAEINFLLKYPYDTIGAAPKVEFQTQGNRVFLTLKDGTTILESLYLYAITSTSPTALAQSLEDDVMPLAATGSAFDWDIEGLMKFSGYSQYFSLTVVDKTGTGAISDLIKLRDHLETLSTFSITNTPGTITNGSYKAPSTEADYDQDTIDILADYIDVYQVHFSGINQLIGSDNAYKVHHKWASTFVDLMEYTLYVEVPCTSINATGAETAWNHTQMINWVNTHINQVGNSKYIAYFGGGIKYYDSEGNLRNGNTMGAVLGLGDSCASNYGPWKSFAGMNRGIIEDAVGPVVPNYGSPSRYNQLNELAQNYINMVVIKDVPNRGKQTLLWHLFSSQFKQDSERFLIIVRLNLYLKKTLRPIMEKYIEEPNIWSTWKLIWAEVKPILDNLVKANAMSEYNWIGDQNASSYKDLVVNNEADVRQGKYKAYLRYKDIVTMQEITISIMIDAADKSVTINEE